MPNHKRQVVDRWTNMHGHDSFSVNCNSFYPWRWHLKNHQSRAKDILGFQSNNKITTSTSAFADHQTHLAHLQTISPGNSESAIVGGQSKNVVCCSQFPAASRSVLRHGAQIDDTGCLEISAPQQDVSYKQSLIYELTMITSKWVYWMQKCF